MGLSWASTGGMAAHCEVGIAARFGWQVGGAPDGMSHWYRWDKWKEVREVGKHKGWAWGLDGLRGGTELGGSASMRSLHVASVVRN